MADLNSLIAQGAQFQALPDPFVQYGRMQQLQQGQQANQLNQMKLQEAQAAAAERNALRQFLPSLNESNRSQLLGYGAAGQNIFKTMAEGDTQQRLTAQAKSQAELNKSNILKNVVAQTRDAVAGIDPNDAPSYLTLRTSVLSQYPDLEPYMPPAWDANVKQRLIDTAASVLERQKPEPGFTLSAGQVRYPAGYTGVATAPTAADKPPEKLEIMRVLGYSMDAAGDAAYEAAKRAAPTVAAPPAEISTMVALGIPVTPDGFAYFQQLKTKPVVAESPLAKLQREMDALPPSDSRRAQYVAAINKEITRAPAPVVNISNVQEKAEAADYGKLLVKDYDAVKASASLAQKSLPALESNLAILNNGFSTGFGTETVAAGAKVLGALGVKDAEKFATNAQVFLANANNAVLQKQLEQKGVQTAADADRITSTGAQFGNTKDANEFIIKVAKEQLQRDIEQRDFYAAWRDKNQTFNGAENAWSTGPGSKSLFDRPALKKYAAAPPPSGANLIPGSTPAAGGGATVTLPDGRVKTFPNAAAANQFKKAAGL